MHAKFQAMGYQSTLLTDASRNGLEQALDKFSELVPTADVAVVYYAGHAIQVDGKNYLIPVDARIKNKRDLKKLTLLDELTLEVSNARELGVVIVDACRDNPFGMNMTTELGRNVRVSAGLSGAGVVGGNTLIAYATEEGAIAADGYDTHSPYTKSLLDHVDTLDLDIRLMFGRVRDDVLKKTNGAQRPSVYGSLGGNSYFLRANNTGTEPQTATQLFDSLKSAIANRDEKRIKQLAHNSSKWGAYVQYLISNFESVELSLSETKLTKKGTEATAKISIIEMSMFNGDKGFPSESMSTIVLKSRFDGDQWSKILW